MRKVVLFIAILALGGCAGKDTSVQDAIEKHPEIVFNAIEKNPDQFMEAVNRAAQAAQRNQIAQRQKARADQEAQDLAHPKMPHFTDDRRLQGTAAAPITVVEYGDFQCPACGIAYRNLKQFEAAHPGQIQFVFKDMPLDFHKMAYPAALYFEAVREQSPEKARKYYDLLYENQKRLAEPDFLLTEARAVGADVSKVTRDVKAKSSDKIIQDDIAEFQGFGFTGTPVIIINGVALEGAEPAEELERVAQLTLQKKTKQTN